MWWDLASWPPVVLVAVMGLVTALATGLGALPFLFLRKVDERMVARADTVAAGLMLGASFGLLQEGRHHGIAQTIVGGLVGAVFIVVGERLLADREVNFGEVSGAGAKEILLLLGVMTLHSFSEGVAVGVAFGGGQQLATLITVAIAIHNIPEGLAISAVMFPKGTSVLRCAGWSIFSSLPQPLMAVPAFLFVEWFRPVLPYGLGFAAGAMVFMVLFEILPKAYESLGRASVGLHVSVAFGAMVLFQQLVG